MFGIDSFLNRINLFLAKQQQPQTPQGTEWTRKNKLVFDQQKRKWVQPGKETGAQQPIEPSYEKHMQIQEKPFPEAVWAKLPGFKQHMWHTLEEVENPPKPGINPNTGEQDILPPWQRRMVEEKKVERSTHETARRTVPKSWLDANTKSILQVGGTSGFLEAGEAIRNVGSALGAIGLSRDQMLDMGVYPLAPSKDTWMQNNGEGWGGYDYDRAQKAIDEYNNKHEFGLKVENAHDLKHLIDSGMHLTGGKEPTKKEKQRLENLTGNVKERHSFVAKVNSVLGAIRSQREGKPKDMPAKEWARSMSSEELIARQKNAHMAYYVAENLRQQAINNFNELEKRSKGEARTGSRKNEGAISQADTEERRKRLASTRYEADSWKQIVDFLNGKLDILLRDRKDLGM